MTRAATTPTESRLRLPDGGTISQPTVRVRATVFRSTGTVMTASRFSAPCVSVTVVNSASLTGDATVAGFSVDLGGVSSPHAVSPTLSKRTR